ncbi:MAG: exodeoxyribonuclease VII large subunit [Phycisphaerales bacterium]|nr:MAG: exodeoxyribonuclease VII large subunit [Phycisphaerales bacterium]
MVKRRPGKPAPSGGTEARPTFDPSKMAAQPGAPAPAASDVPISITRLAALIDGALRAGVPAPVRVRGEVSGFNDRTHWWFNLKDEDAVVSCVMFASAAKRAGFVPENGQEVVARGRIEHYAKQGKTQLYIDKMEPAGAGALEMRFRALCEEIRSLGWFDVERKRPPAWFPRRVAVVTSRTGAALQDVLDTMRKRCPGVGVVLVDVMVQGAHAAPQIAAAIRRVSDEHERLGVDTMIVTRGGGSMEDLWAFNERVVAEAIVRSAVPVVAAIGHETDTTIAELVADERCATPTQAAMRCTPDRTALAQQVDQHARRLRAALRSGVNARRARLERASARLSRSRPEAVYAARRERVARLRTLLRDALHERARAFDADRAQERLDRALRDARGRAASRLDAAARTLDMVGPVNVLRRGYSVTLRADGRAVRAPGDVRQGDAIETRLATGSLRSIVAPPGSLPPETPRGPDASPGSPPASNPARPARRRKRKPPTEPPTMDLFGDDR